MAGIVNMLGVVLVTVFLF